MSQVVTAPVIQENAIKARCWKKGPTPCRILFVREQLALAKELAPATLPEMPRESLSLYLHFPFCQVRCAYCDFNTYAGLDGLMVPYAQALAREVRLVGAAAEAGGHT